VRHIATRATADRFGAQREATRLLTVSCARQQLGRQGGNLASNRAGDGRLDNRAGGDLGQVTGSAGGGPDSIGGRDLTGAAQGNRRCIRRSSRGSRDTTDSSARANGSRGAPAWDPELEASAAGWTWRRWPAEVSGVHCEE